MNGQRISGKHTTQEPGGINNQSFSFLSNLRNFRNKISWVTQIGTDVRQNFSELFKQSPMLEARGSDQVKSSPRPRVIKTHMSYDDLPKSSKARYIMVARNPKDVCVSFYFHHKNLHWMYDWEEITFDKFYDMFFSNKVLNL